MLTAERVWWIQSLHQSLCRTHYSPSQALPSMHVCQSCPFCLWHLHFTLHHCFCFYTSVSLFLYLLHLLLYYSCCTFCHLLLFHCYRIIHFISALPFLWLAQQRVLYNKQHRTWDSIGVGGDMKLQRGGDRVIHRKGREEGMCASVNVVSKNKDTRWQWRLICYKFIRMKSEYSNK